MIPSLDIFPGGCLITTPSHEIIYANAFMAELLARDRKAIIGSMLTDYLPAASRIFLETYVKPMLMNDGHSSQVDMSLITVTGARVPVAVNACVMPDDPSHTIWCIVGADNRARVYEDLLKTREELRAQTLELYALSTTDPLTGMLNRREFMRLAAADFVTADRTGHPVSILLIDLDHFKSVNDRFGHVIGDEVLKEVGGILKSMRTHGEVPARFGGEEFICCLCNAQVDHAKAYADRIHRALAQLRFAGFQPTASIGVFTRGAGAGVDLDAAIERADEALYAAKAAGRNNTTVHPSSDASALPSEMFGKPERRRATRA